MDILTQLYKSPRQPKIAIILALLSIVLPLPIAGLHKFYLGQYLWGIIYLLLGNTPIPRIACAIDAVWYFLEDGQIFDKYYNSKIFALPMAVGTRSVENVEAITVALEKLEQLRQQGLVSELEFEQKRRQLLERL